jgi:flavin reductase (DIM6/NTAB) family NADH-FMN oxidoreductase RutF
MSQAAVAEFSSVDFRQAMGNFCTGVTIVTGIDDGAPVGFAAQSFVSLSLDPPLIAVCPAKTSSSWPRIRAAGNFCINILAADQLAICQTMAQSGADKFANIDWRTGVTGAPIIHGGLAYVDCCLVNEHEAGDHTIAVGAVKDFELVDSAAQPLLFMRGGYGVFGGT